MSSHTDEERYFMLQELCLRTTKFLHDVFRGRWEAETQTTWKDDKEHHKMFIEGHGRKLYKEVTSFQKTILNSAKVDDWDMSIICLAIGRFESSTKDYIKENSAVNSIGKIGCSLAGVGHLKAVSESEYDEKIKSITACLKSLDNTKCGVVQSWIREVESVQAAIAFREAKEIFEEARHCVNRQRWDEANDLFTDAINIPNLLPVLRAAKYQERARFLTDHSNDLANPREKLRSALIDLKDSLSINNFSWLTHYCTGKYYHIIGQWSLAIYHFERASLIGPVEVKHELEKFKKIAFGGVFDDPLRPTVLNLITYEYMILIKEENIHINKITLVFQEPERRFFTNSDADDPGFEQALLGFGYCVDRDVDENFETAFEHFQQSANYGNSEGTVALAKCYLNGHGVEEDPQQAYEIFMQVTQMRKYWPGLSTPIRGDRGIAEAQHCLGRLCFEEEAYHTAGFWFEWSMDNGHGYSATLYGNMIACKLLAEKDIKMAKMCWKEGVNLKAPTALKWLLRYYLKELEPDLAAEYFRYGRAAKNDIILEWSEDCFSELIADIRKYRETKEYQVLMFEMEYNLTWKGLTFMDRLKRTEFYSDSNVLRFESFLRTNPNLKVVRDSLGGPQQLTDDIILEILIKAEKKDIFAVSFSKVYRHALALEEMFEGKEEITEDERLEMLDTLYELITMGQDLMCVLNLPRDKIMSNIDLLRNNEENWENGDIDAKLGICYAVLREDTADEEIMADVLQVLIEGAQLYPNNTYYNKLVSKYLLLRHDIRGSRYWTELALKKEPDNVEFLFQLARLETVPDECIQIYRRITEVGVKGHRLIPEAFYSIVSAHLQQYLYVEDHVCDKKERAKEIKENLNKALEAENHLLPCYLPYRKADIFRQIHLVFEETKENEAEWRKQEYSAIEQSKTLFDRKHYLRSPTRKLLIRLHRRDFRRTIHLGSQSNLVTEYLEQPITQTLSSLKPITLQEMNVVDMLYCFENRRIEVTVLDNSFIADSAINCVVEDDNGDVIRLFISNTCQSELTVQSFAVGSRFAVANPQMMCDSEGRHNWLIVYGFNCIFFMDGVTKMCGFCGEENSTFSCPTCGRLYCSSECLQWDVERHDHEVICIDTKPNPEK